MQNLISFLKNKLKKTFEYNSLEKYVLSKNPKDLYEIEKYTNDFYRKETCKCIL